MAENFQGSERTARSYMQISTRWPEIESKRQRVAVLSYRDAVKLLSEPRRETAQTGKAEPALWAVDESNRRALKRLNIECAIGGN